jgi:uracil-DNA glycosylase family 4
MSIYGFKKEEFGIIHSINCYNKNKPSESHRDNCREWLAKFINRINPELIICCGNFALHTITGKWGISKYENKVKNIVLFKKQYNVMFWRNTNIVNYNDKTLKSIKMLKSYLKR